MREGAGQGTETVLVTGCSGFIGSALVPALRDEGYRVVGADREDPGDLALDGFCCGDLADPEVARKVVKEASAVFHLAAAKDDWGISDEKFHHDNVVATRSLLRAAADEGVRDWVFFSTVSAIGPSADPVGEEAPLDPVTVYGETKARGEMMFRSFAADDPEVRVLILRPSVVFGKGMPPYTNVFRLVDGIYRRRFVMVGDGDEIKTTSYLENLVAATLFLTRHWKRGVHPYIYVDYPRLTTEQMVSLVHELLDRDRPDLWIPERLAASVASVFDVLGGLFHINFPVTRDRIEKFCTPTNYRSHRIRDKGFEQPVSCEEAFARTVRWYLETYPS